MDMEISCESTAGEFNIPDVFMPFCGSWKSQYLLDSAIRLSYNGRLI